MQTECASRESFHIPTLHLMLLRQFRSRGPSLLSLPALEDLVPARHSSKLSLNAESDNVCCFLNQRVYIFVRVSSWQPRIKHFLRESLGYKQFLIRQNKLVCVFRSSIHLNIYLIRKAIKMFFSHFSHCLDIQ